MSHDFCQRISWSWKIAKGNVWAKFHIPTGCGRCIYIGFQKHRISHRENLKVQDLTAVFHVQRSGMKQTGWSTQATYSGLRHPPGFFSPPRRWCKPIGLALAACCTWLLIFQALPTRSASQGWRRPDSHFPRLPDRDALPRLAPRMRRNSMLAVVGR